MPTEPQPLLNLESCLTAGAMFYGTGVQWVQVGTVDGRVQRLELPTSATDPADDVFDGAEPSETEAEILKALASLKPGEWMKGSTLATAANLVYDGGQWWAIVKRMKAAGRIESRKNGGGYRLKT